MAYTRVAPALVCLWLFGCSNLLGIDDWEDVDCVEQCLGSDAYSTRVLADAPLAYWRLDEQSGSVASDATGHGHAATYGDNCALGETGALGSGTALRFDNPTCLLDMGDAFAFPETAPYSIELWVLLSSADGDNRTIYDRDTLTDPHEGYNLYYSAQFLLFSRYSAGAEVGYAGSNTPPTLGQFAHLVATYDGTRARLYVNAELAPTSSASPEPAGTGAGRLVFGRTARATTSSFDGFLDEIAIYDRALYDQEVSSHFLAATE